MIVDIAYGFVYWRPEESARYLKPFEDYIWEAWESKTLKSFDFKTLKSNCYWMILK